MRKESTDMKRPDYCRSVWAVCLALTMLFSRCANPVMPSGGPKDVAPPRVLREVPPGQSVNFNSDRITLTFDEFIQVRDATGQVIISPPLEEEPKFRVRGRDLEIMDIKGLMPQTTYSIYFGDAVSDITENNILQDYRYAFSTGSTIDSLQVKGMLVDAFTLLPEKGAWIMLYEKASSDPIPDSMPYLVRPCCLTRTLPDGSFVLSNLKASHFRLFALTDLNANLLYDLPAEKIAFLDSLIMPYTIEKPVTDTAGPDSVRVLATKSPLVNLYLFDETDSIQALLKADLVKTGHVRLSFKYPLVNPEVSLLRPEAGPDWCLRELSSGRDTLHCWLQNLTADTLILEFRDAGFCDTLTVPMAPSLQGKKSTKTTARPGLKISGNFITGVLDIFRPLSLSFDYPVTAFYPDLLRLVDGTDTISPPIAFRDAVKRKAVMDYPFKEDRKYRLFIDKGAFTALEGITHDSIRYDFRTNKKLDHGNFILNLTADTLPSPVILQLLDEQGRKKESRVLNRPGKVEFLNLLPAEVKLKVIFDANGNSRWDTGNYLEGLEPEKVVIYPGTIQIRANWDLQADWKL
jgi:hypothetical protein